MERGRGEGPSVRGVLEQLAKSRENVILDSIAEGVFTVDSDWRITSFNRAAETITGTPRDEAIGKHCYEVFRASICENACALRETMETGETQVNRQGFIVNADGDRVPIDISTALLRNESGHVIGGVETFRDLSLVEELRKEITRRYTFADLVSKSRLMQEIFDILPDIAESDSTVLIEGESGTGKELVALAIHNLSYRKEKPLVVVNCGAIPDTLLESELFGHKKGAFTDARKDKPGKFALADGGTIFLDEIGDVSPALQVRLLRVLQEKTYEPLGGTKPVKADVRVVAATNKNLAELMKRESFRQDLYYRVNVIRVVLPPLRERKEDIPILLKHFIARFNRIKGKNIFDASPEVLEILMKHDFPGNVRELENIVEHTFVLCQSGTIMPRHLPLELRPSDDRLPSSGAASFNDLEARFIRQVLQQNDWNRQIAARELGVHPSTLWRKIKKLGIELPPRDGRNTR